MKKFMKYIMMVVLVIGLSGMPAFGFVVPAFGMPQVGKSMPVMPPPVGPELSKDEGHITRANGYFIYDKKQWDKINHTTKMVVISQWIGGFVTGYPHALLTAGYGSIDAMIMTNELFAKINQAALHPKQMAARIEAWYKKYKRHDVRPSVVFSIIFTQFLNITIAE